MLWTLLGIFMGGMALNLTPCVYPIIPITVSYFGGKSGQGRGRLLIHGLCTWQAWPSPIPPWECWRL